MVSEPAIAEYLLPILLYIGSIFTPSVETAPLEEIALRVVQARCTSTELPNAYYIQALMLYSIAVYWCNSPGKGRELLDQAIEGAFSISMHEQEFAVIHGLGDSVLEESWRRTWWQIYVTDAHISGSTHTYKGLSTKYPTNVELPCEEHDYESGVSSSSLSTQHT
jgi:hypothetical protein